MAKFWPGTVEKDWLEITFTVYYRGYRLAFMLLETYDSGSAVERDVFPRPQLPRVPPLGAEERRVGEFVRHGWVQVPSSVKCHRIVAHGVAFQNADARCTGRTRQDRIGECLLDLICVSVSPLQGS
jgi:hypothetical protein